MRRLMAAKALWLAKKLDPRHLRKLSRKQIIQLTLGVVAVYGAVLAVNVAILYNGIDSNEAKTEGLRKTLDFMSFNYNLGSKILDEDLTNQKAVARLGAYYLTEDRFNRIAASEKQFRSSAGDPFNTGNVRSRAEAIIRRMAVEQLVAQYARDFKFEADPNEVEKRIAMNVLSHGSLKKLEKSLKDNYNWTLADFRYEIEYAMLKAKMEEALGGERYEEAAKRGFQNSDTPKVKDYADHYARTHTNYLVAGGYDTLAKRLLEL